MHARLLHGRAFAARSMLSAHTALIQDGVPRDVDADDIEAYLAKGYPKVRLAARGGGGGGAAMSAFPSSARGHACTTPLKLARLPPPPPAPRALCVWSRSST